MQWRVANSNGRRRESDGQGANRCCRIQRATYRATGDCPEGVLAESARNRDRVQRDRIVQSQGDCLGCALSDCSRRKHSVAECKDRELRRGIPCSACQGLGLRNVLVNVIGDAHSAGVVLHRKIGRIVTVSWRREVDTDHATCARQHRGAACIAHDSKPAGVVP